MLSKFADSSSLNPTYGLHQMPATRSKLFAMAMALSLGHASRIYAQQTDTARCRAVLTGPTQDSARVRVGMTVTSFDTTAVVSATYRSMFIQAFREAFKIPHPLLLDVYSQMTAKTDKGIYLHELAHGPVIAGYYRATLKQDGHIANARVVGGTGLRAFNDAVLAAIRAVGDSQTAPPFPDEMKSDALELHITIRTMEMFLQRIPDQPPEPRLEPLFAMHIPLFGDASHVTPDPNNPSPRYPERALRARADGVILSEFVIGSDGRIDLQSLQLPTATATPFVTALLDVLPQHRFAPLQLNGCPVATLVREPFNFNIRR